MKSYFKNVAVECYPKTLYERIYEERRTGDFHDKEVN